MFFESVRTQIGAAAAARPISDPLGAGVFALDPFAAPPRNVMQTLFAARTHATLAAALVAADMAVGLEGRGPFTLFAPSDAAFDRSPRALIRGLITPDERARLAKLLRAHLVTGRFETRDFRALIDRSDGRARLDTVGGEPLFLACVQGAIRVGTATGATAMIVGPDRYQTNGMIHAVNGVLVP
jgi:uncharacterized surface protein with fasciclin (FAS1) repeats